MECACGAALHVPVAAPPPDSLSFPVSSEPYREPLCPRCQAPLELLEEDGIVVTACPAHHGLFVARGALHALEHESVATVRKLDEEAEAPAISLEVLGCPRCGEPMAAHVLPAAGVVVDECKAHGTWFDAGELEAAMAARALGAPAGNVVETYQSVVLGGGGTPPR